MATLAPYCAHTLYAIARSLTAIGNISLGYTQHMGPQLTPKAKWKRVTSATMPTLSARGTPPFG